MGNTPPGCISCSYSLMGNTPPHCIACSFKILGNTPPHCIACSYSIMGNTPPHCISCSYYILTKVTIRPCLLIHIRSQSKFSFNQDYQITANVPRLGYKRYKAVLLVVFTVRPYYNYVWIALPICTSALVKITQYTEWLIHMNRYRCHLG